MTAPTTPPLTPEDEALIERFRRHFAPPQRTAAQRVMLRNAIEAQLHRPRLPTWVSIATATCAAAVALWLVLPQRSGILPKPAPTTSGDVLAAYALEGDSPSEIDDLLPPDYAAMQSILEL